MFFLLYGEDTLRARRKLTAMRERFSATRDATGLNAQVFRVKDADIDEVAGVIFASPFLAEKKLVVLEGFCGAAAADQEKLVDVLARKPEGTNVICFEAAGAEDLAKSALFAVLRKQKFTEECVKMTAAQQEAFVIEECLSSGVAISPRDARALVGVVGEDSWQLHEEVAKLCAYVAARGEKVVTTAMLDTLIPGVKEESMFALIDACVDGRAGVAGAMLEKMLEAGTSELQILAMLQKQFRTLIAVADLVRRGERDKYVVAQRVGIHHFPAGKAISAVGRMEMPKLRAQYDALLEIERQIKTSAGRPNALLGLWLAKG